MSRSSNPYRDQISPRAMVEEFAVILPDTKLNDAVHSAEHIRKKIMGRELKQRSTGSTLGSITVSIGVSALNKGETERDLFHRADINLYEAKRSGRNCTCFSSEANVSLRAYGSIQGFLSVPGAASDLLKASVT